MEMSAAAGTAAAGEPLGVVLLHMGGPREPSEVRPFLRRLLADPAMVRLPAALRLPLAWTVSTLRAGEARRRYALMGGGSPAVAQVTALAGALEEALRAAGAAGAAVEPAFLYCGQDSETALRRLAGRGARCCVAVAEYPQYSGTTTGASLRALERAQRAAAGAAPRVDAVVRSWSDRPEFADLWADLIARTAGEFFAGGPPPYLLFTAHGLPASYVRRGDPYADQVRRAVAAVAARLPRFEHGLAFQSRVGPVRWIGPDVVPEVRRLAAAGHRELLLAPISFLTDHVETLVELDLELAETAHRAGISRIERTPPAASSPLAARALAAAVLAAAQQSAQAEPRPPAEAQT